MHTLQRGQRKITKDLHILFKFSFVTNLKFFQEGHTNRSCKLHKAQNARGLTRDDYEFWSCVNVDALPVHDRNENDSDYDDDGDDEDDDDDDDDGDDDSGDDDNDANDNDADDEGPLDLFCGETFLPTH